MSDAVSLTDAATLAAHIRKIVNRLHTDVTDVAQFNQCIEDIATLCDDVVNADSDFDPDPFRRMPDAPHVVIDGNTGEFPEDLFLADKRCYFSYTSAMKCLHCGEKLAMPFGDLDFVLGVTDAFARAHAGCKSTQPAPQPT